MTEEEWLALETLNKFKQTPLSWLRKREPRRIFLFLSASLPRFMFGRFCPACQHYFPLFEKHAEGLATVEDWIQAVKAKHSGIEGEVECVTRRMFRCTIAYLNDLFSPSFFWDMLVQIQGNISQQIQQQHLSDTDRSWSETQRDKIHEIGRENLRLLKEMVGNPFRPITFNPSWLTSTVLALAKGIYQEKAFDRMPILADALQDAGCNNDDLLNHLRSDGPHVLGCWALDIILGKK